MKKKVVFLAVFLIIAGVTSGLGVKYYETPQRGIASTPKVELSYEDKIRAVVKQNLKQIESCYNQRIQGGLERVGKLKISWHINEQGMPLNLTEMENELHDPELYDCSSNVISDLKFPKGNYYQVNYTFNLKNKDQKVSVE